MYIIIHWVLAQVILLQQNLKQNHWVIKVGNKLNWHYVMILA